MVIYWNSNVNILIFWETGFLTFIKIKTKKSLKRFTLHVKNLKYMKVSLFETLHEKKELFHDIQFFLDVPLYQTAQIFLL